MSVASIKYNIKNAYLQYQRSYPFVAYFILCENYGKSVYINNLYGQGGGEALYSIFPNACKFCQ
jgi:hypothetical protein